MISLLKDSPTSISRFQNPTISPEISRPNFFGITTFYLFYSMLVTGSPGPTPHLLCIEFPFIWTPSPFNKFLKFYKSSNLFVIFHTIIRMILYQTYTRSTTANDTLLHPIGTYLNHIDLLFIIDNVPR